MTAEAPPVKRGPVLIPDRGLRRALIVVGAATGLAIGGLLGYDVLQPKGQAPQPTPISGGVGEPTPSATPEITIAPTPEATPTSTPPKIPSPPPETTPTLSPEQILAQNLKDFVEGKTKIPKERFYRTSDDKTPLRINILDTEVSYNQEIVAVDFQGTLLGEEEVADKNGVKHLVAYVGFVDNRNNQYYFPITLGRINTTDKSSIELRGPILYNSPYAQKVNYIPISEMEEELKAYKGKNVCFTLYAAEPETWTQGSIGAEIKAQNPVAKAIIEWSKNVVNAPYSYQKVPMDNLVKKLINQPVETFDASSVPLAWPIVPYTAPPKT